MKSGLHALRDGVRRHRWTLLAVCVAALILTRPWSPSRVERLRETGAGAGSEVVGVRDGLFLTLVPGAIALMGEPVHGGPRRVVVPPTQAPRSIEAVEVKPQGARFYAAEPITSAGRGGMVPSRYRLRVWEATFDGRPAREVVQSPDRVQVGETLFRLRRPGAAGASEAAAKCELVATPAEGGAERVIASGFASDQMLVPLENGISWTVPEGGDYRHRELFFALPPFYEVRALHDCSGIPVRFGERFFWIDRVYSNFSTGSANIIERGELATARADGSDRRTVLDLLHNAEWEVQGDLLGVYQDQLFAVLFRRAPMGGLRPGAPTLCRVTPDSVEPLFLLPDAPSGHWFDGGYLYFSTFEDRDNWLAWSRSGLSVRRVELLYRVRLPRLPASTGERPHV